MRTSQVARILAVACAATLAIASHAQCLSKQIQVFSHVQPWDMIAADFNHDSAPDLVIATSNSEKEPLRFFSVTAKGHFKSRVFVNMKLLVSPMWLQVTSMVMGTWMS